MRYVLGISCFFHDSAAALVSSNGIECAFEEERFTRNKHDNRFPKNSILACLKYADITIDQVDRIVFYENPKIKLDRVLSTFFKYFPKTKKIARSIIHSWHAEKLWVPQIISRSLGISKSKIVFLEHHQSHAASSFFASGFESAAVLSLDGVGEWVTSQAGRYIGNNYQKYWEINFPHSLGLLYSSFAQYLGFEVNEGEFKVMGMAAYGSPVYKDKVEKLFLYRNPTDFKLDLSYFSYHYSDQINYTDKFIELFGKPRNPESSFLQNDSDLKSYSFDLSLMPAEQKYYADIAASLQSLVEDQILAMSKKLHEISGEKNLCYSGGVALNSVANGLIMKNAGFDSVYIQPAAGDSGSALGAALYYLSNIEGFNPDKLKMKSAALGVSYSNDECIAELMKVGITNFEVITNQVALLDKVARILSEGNVIGWFQDRFEFGPRALGYRSILADPRSEAMKAKVNLSVKFRELFRPFAPMVMKEFAQDFFVFTDEELNQDPYKYMLAVTSVKNEKRGQLQAITHVDGTARVQVVDEESNSKIYGLLEKFKLITGVPVLLNTSFNRRGEPMVASPEDAIRTFMWSGLDYLILNNIIISKQD